MGIRAILNGIAPPPTPDSNDADIRRTTPARGDGQPTAAQADVAIGHVTRQFALTQNSVVQTPIDEQSANFRTSGGSWRTPNDNPQHVRFYREGEDTSNTTRFDREYYPTSRNEYVRLNGRGALAGLPEHKGKPKPESVSTFDWQGWEKVDASRVPGEYTTEGKTISFKDTNNAQNQNTVLRRYIQQNVIGTDRWMGDADTDERAVARAGELGVRVEIEEAGKSDTGETLYRVKISDEDLAKLRGVKAEWQAQRARIADGVERGRQETDRMFTDQGRVVWNSGVNIVEGTINSGLDAIGSQGGRNPLYALHPNRPQVDFSGAKTAYQSEMMRRDHNGVVDGDGIKAGDAIETGVTIAAPFVVGMATKPTAPLQELGLPRTSAATSATEAQTARSISSAAKTEETVSVSNTANATERTIKFSAKQLQKKYKHADVFGIPENYTPANAARFQNAIEQHISNPATRVIQGTYRKTNSVTHFVNPQTGVNVIRDASGQFHSAWKLNAEQLQNVLNRGSL